MFEVCRKRLPRVASMAVFILPIAVLYFCVLGLLAVYGVQELEKRRSQDVLGAEISKAAAFISSRLEGLCTWKGALSDKELLKAGIARDNEAQRRLQNDLRSINIGGRPPTRIGLIDWRGNVFASAQPGADQTGVDWAEHSLAGRYNFQFHSRGMRFSMPLRIDGNIIGAFFVDVPQEAVITLLMPFVSLGDVVLTYKGRFVLTTSDQFYMKHIDRQGASASLMTVELNIPEHEDFKLAVGVPLSQVRAASGHHEMLVWFVAFASLLGSLTLIVFYAHNYIRKISDVASALDLITTAADLNRTPAFDSTSSLSALTDALRNMLHRLKQNVVSKDALRTEDQIRKQAQEEARDTEARNQAILNTATEGIFTVDSDGVIKSVNPAANDIFHNDHNTSLIGKHISALIPGISLMFSVSSSAGPAPEEDRLGTIEGSELIGVRSNRSTFPLELSLAKMELVGRTMYVGVVRDISDQKDVERKLSDAANHDHLTGLPNRRSFIEKVSALTDSLAGTNKKLALYMIDLDHFKEVNDYLGHGAGDELLKLVAQKLQDATGPTDITARLGGDEFAMASICDSRELARDLASELLDETNCMVSLSGADVYMRTSIGVAVFPDDALDSGTLFRNSDIALYRAKLDGRGHYTVFSEEMAIEAERKNTLEQELRVALEKDDLHISVQPKIDLATAQVTGVEVLSRWEHAELKTVNPVEFIPIAEERGLISELGRRVLFKSCKFAAEWPDLEVSVNISPAQFVCGDIVGMVRDVLRHASIDPSRLTLEITEGLFLKDDQNILEQILDLRMMGVRLSLDDFGTGYSSLNYLTRLPIDEIKIDKSFVDQLCDQRGAEIIVAVLGLAKSLGLKVVAEGVETEQQLEFLRANGCDYAQGYFIGKAIDQIDFSCADFSDLDTVKPSSVGVASVSETLCMASSPCG